MSGSMRSQSIAPGLLPEGLRDHLPPHAEREAQLQRQAIDCLMANGYERVSPPLVEFEANIAGPLGEAAGTARHFRFLDPRAQMMLALRADMTGQVARIATTRMAHYARPLRLCYSGNVVRVASSQVRADRQFLQVGAELIGTDSAGATAEVVALALEAASAMGAGGLALDLVSPALLPALAGELGFNAAQASTLLAAFDVKDRAAVAALPNSALLLALMDCIGPASSHLPRLKALALPPATAAIASRLLACADMIAEQIAVPVSFDPGERRGFEYQTHVGFSLFADGVRGELGRGGSYVIAADSAPDGQEPAVGFSLYLNDLALAGQGGIAARRVLVPPSMDRQARAQLQALGWVTLRALDADSFNGEQALALRCTAIWDGTMPRPLQE